MLFSLFTRVRQVGLVLNLFLCYLISTSAFFLFLKKKKKKKKLKLKQIRVCVGGWRRVVASGTFVLVGWKSSRRRLTWSATGLEQFLVVVCQVERCRKRFVGWQESCLHVCVMVKHWGRVEGGGWFEFEASAFSEVQKLHQGAGWGWENNENR